MASTRTGRSSGVLSQLLSAGREGEKETGCGTREDQERGLGLRGSSLLRKGIRGGLVRPEMSTLCSCSYGGDGEQLLSSVAQM
jgi:hypothetical protein